MASNYKWTMIQISAAFSEYLNITIIQDSTAGNNASLVLRLSRLLLKSLTTLCAYGNFALHKIVPQYVLSPSASVHPYEVCRRRRRAATVVRSCVAGDGRRSLGIRSTTAK